MKLWIDADAAPGDVKDVVYRAAIRLDIQTVMVANQRLQQPANNPLVTAVRVEGGPDVADRHIEAHAQSGDVAVTADIPLAAALVGKGVAVIDPRGLEYTTENVGERLSIRDFMDQVRMAGTDIGGPSTYGAREKRAFAGTLDRVLTRVLRGSLPGEPGHGNPGRG